MTQQSLFDRPAPIPKFDGVTIEPQDVPRLATALGRVLTLMRDGEWRTLATIASECGTSEAGASARLRDLRKERFGSHTVERRRVDGGLWEYRVVD